MCGVDGTFKRLPGEDALARLVTAIQWHESDPFDLHLGGQSFRIDAPSKSSNIDRILDIHANLEPRELERAACALEAMRGPSTICTWDELKSLTSLGVEIGAHSVSHVRLSAASPQRKHFEIAESKRLIERHLGSCDSFAYPFGMHDTHDEESRYQLELAGYRTGFLTHSDFIATGADPLTLPRVSMPDHPISMEEFRARAGGLGIALRRGKQLVTRNRRTSAIAAHPLRAPTAS